MRELKFVFFIMRSRVKVKARLLCKVLCGAFWDVGVYVVSVLLLLKLLGG